jgi:hypothetical protein
MSFSNFGGNAFGGFQQSQRRQPAAGQSSSLGFQSTPAFGQTASLGFQSPSFGQKSSVAGTSFDSGNIQAAGAYNPFAGRAEGTYVTPVNATTATAGRQISFMA